MVKAGASREYIWVWHSHAHKHTIVHLQMARVRRRDFHSQFFVLPEIFPTRGTLFFFEPEGFKNVAKCSKMMRLEFTSGRSNFGYFIEIKNERKLATLLADDINL